MKTLHVLLLFLICAPVSLVAQSDCSNQDGVSYLTTKESEVACPSGNLVLVFQDEFDGNELDHTKWYERERVIRDFNFVHSKQFYKKENVEVEGGKLKILAKRESVSNAFFGDNAEFTSSFDFTSGEINTLYEFGYGVYEIRCRLPRGATKGFFPAFWGFSDAAGIWNEIDFFEAWSSHNYEKKDGVESYPLKEVSFTHFGTWGDDVYRCTSRYKDDVDLGSDFHTFKVVYRPDYIEWYLDGTLRSRSYKFYSLLGQGLNCGNTQVGQHYIRKKSMPLLPLNVKIDLAIENGTAEDSRVGNRAPASDSKLPNSFEVDYVKIWQYLPCNGDLIINGQSEFDALISSQDKFYNAVYAANISIDNAVLKSGKNLVIFSNGDIDLGPDFITENGSYFDIKSLDSNPCQGTAPPRDRTLSNFGNIEFAHEEYRHDAHRFSRGSDHDLIVVTADHDNHSVNINHTANEDNISYGIEVTNSLGQMVYKGRSGLASALTLDPEIFNATGVYVVKVFNPNGSFLETHKVVME